MQEEIPHEFLKKSPLFASLSDDSLKAIKAVSHELHLKKGDFLMKEGDEASDIFFIVEGDLEIIKCDAETKSEFVVNTVHAGSALGEQALIDKGKRSASIRCATDARLYRISFTDLEKLSKDHPDICGVYTEISREISEKLRKTTDIALVALKNELREYKQRVGMGSFLVYVITVITLFIFTVRPLKFALSHVPDTTYISIPFIIVLTIFVVLIIRACPFPLREFGFTTNQWKKSISEGFFFTLPFLGFSVLVKWLLILYYPPYKGHPIFDPFALMPNATLSYWIINSLVYCLFVPLQEIMARGALQGPLEKFLSTKHKVFTSIVISNLIFSAAHVFLSEEIAVLVFISGLFFGWIYSRTYNLMGVILSHCMVGVWGLNVLGPVF